MGLVDLYGAVVVGEFLISAKLFVFQAFVDNDFAWTLATASGSDSKAHAAHAKQTN